MLPYVHTAYLNLLMFIKVNGIIRNNREKGKYETCSMRVAFPRTSDVLQMCISEVKPESEGEAVRLFID